MATLTFDKLAYIDRLKEAGIDERHARAHADGLDQAFRKEIVTKADLKAGLDEVRGEISAVRGEIAAVRGELAADKSELKGDITALRSELKGDIAALQSEFKSDIAGLRSELRSEFRCEIAVVKNGLAALEAKIGRHDWMLGSLIGLNLLILGKLLLH